MKLIQKQLMLAVLFLVSVISSAQDLGIYSNYTMLGVPLSGSKSKGELNFINGCGDVFKVNQGKVWVKLDLGKNYELGSNNAGKLFDIEVDLQLALTTSGDEPAVNFQVNLDNNKPEAMVFVDLNQFIDSNNATTGLSYKNNPITGVNATINSATDKLTNITLNNELKISLHYEIGYGISVANNVVTLKSAELVPNTKVMHFEWEDTCESPNYQFQLLRLFNTEENKITSEKDITANIDWDKSLAFQTYSSKTEIKITIGEGQGYYIWRVRPIGTYNENGIGNHSNWGNWNTSAYTTNTVELNESVITVSPEAFYFEDVDDNINYQYSRVFTEGNKVSEQLSYATTLNQIRQNQRYFPSKGGYKLITQTILDNSGRPTLNTLPAPVKDEKINGYKSNFVKTTVTTSSGEKKELYKAKNFDDDYLNPAIIDASNAFAYYSSLNADTRIPDAEGYPFTRAIFANDGTDRVVNQSGVGKKHMVGNEADGRGKTTKTLYATPTNEELVALFGDEAPNHQDVAKVITIDPNKTKSVVYITKDGKTIATGLTFSEDEAVLESVKSTNGAIVSGKTDYISNNIKTTDGFKASKRIAILEDNTTINLSYSITKPVLEGLCNNVEFNLDYAIKVQVFDALTSKVVKEFEQPSIRELVANPDDTDVYNIGFGSVSLNTGSYYVQKTLVPSDKIKADLVSAEDNIRRLIEPFFNWVVYQLDEVDCEQEMQVFYEDLYFYGKIIANKNLQNELNDKEKLEFPSGIQEEFKKKYVEDGQDPDEVKDEFIDYYTSRNGEGYAITINELTDQGLAPISYDANTIGNKIPVSVNFKTPCCEFTIPVVFTPPFRVPTPEAIDAFMAKGFDAGLNQGNYTPNTNFLTVTEDNFQYEQDDNSPVTIKNGEAYPFDFEGYAISMLYECKKLGDENYSISDAQNEFYSYMRGWHEPGLFNQMVYHMATDSYEGRECSAEPGPNSGGSSDGPQDKYHICDIPKAANPINNAAYTVDQLAQCWEPLVVQLVNELCVEKYELNDQGTEDTVSSNYDKQDPQKPNRHNDMISKKHIKNFVIRWIAIAKLRRKVRKQKVSESGGSPQEEAEKQKNHLPFQFLRCTGYTFADILSPKYYSQNPGVPMYGSDYDDLKTDFDSIIENGEYNNKRLNVAHWSHFGISEGYIDPPTDPNAPKPKNILKDLFGNIEDPVYAFKYYQYKNYSYPQLEGQVCYRDPNLCRVLDTNGNPKYNKDGYEILQPCCGTNASGDPSPCNFCGIGYVKCPYVKKNWDCGQRYSFFEMIRNYREPAEGDGVVVSCENYFEQKEYVVNPDYEKFVEEGNAPDFTLKYSNNSGKKYPQDLFSGLFVLSKPIYDDYVDTNESPSWDELEKKTLKNINGGEATSGISLIENDAREMVEFCEEGCNAKKAEFRKKLIEKFTERCYVIGDCKIDSNDNVVPNEDIDALVNKMIQQCKLQCDISTYACVDEPCRLIGDPDRPDGVLTKDDIYDNNLTYVDYGVSGLITANTQTSRKEQYLIEFDIEAGEYVVTSETPTTNDIAEGRAFYKYSYPTNPSIWDIRKSLTYAQYSRYIQATEWVLNLDLPSKCGEDGEYNPNLVYDANGIAQDAYVYDKNQKKWVLQNYNICANPYVSKDNPDGPGDTFVERDKYIIQSNTPLSDDDERLKTPVKSPEAGIKYVKDKQ